MASTNNQVDQVIQQIVDATYELLDMEHLSFFLLDPKTNELVGPKDHLYSNDPGKGSRRNNNKKKLTKSPQSFRDQMAISRRVRRNKKTEEKKVSTPKLDQLKVTAVSSRRVSVESRHHRGGLIGYVARTKKIIITNSPSHHPAFDENMDGMMSETDTDSDTDSDEDQTKIQVPRRKSKNKDEKTHTKNLITAAIKNSKGNVIGVIQAINKKGASGFYEKDQYVMKKFLHSAGPILSHAQLHEELVVQNRKSKALVKITKAVDEESQFEVFIKKMMGFAEELLNCEKIHLFLIDDIREEIFCKIQNGTIVRSLEKGGIAGLTASSGTTSNLPAMMDWLDKDADEALYAEFREYRRQLKRSHKGTQSMISTDLSSKRPKQYIHSMLCVPIKDSSEKPIAVMWAVNKKAKQIKRRQHHHAVSEIKGIKAKVSNAVCISIFSEDDQELCEAFSAQIGQCLRRFSTDITLILNQEQDEHAQSFLHLYGHNALLRDGNESEFARIRKPSASYRRRLKVAESPAERRGSDILKPRKASLIPNTKMDMDIVNNLVSLAKNKTQSSIETSDTWGVKKSRMLVDWPTNTGLLGLNNSLYQLGTSNRTKLLDSLKTIHFNVWDYDKETLVQLIQVMFEAIPNSLEKLGIDIACLQRFILTCSNLYHDVPYHNFQHAFNVFQLCYYIIQNTDMIQQLSLLEIFSLMIGALTHDIDHPGHTNNFEIYTEGDIAQRYNYQAVLENHHCNTALRILRDPETNILNTETTKLTLQDVRHARTCFIQGILATDMGEHFQMCHKLERMKPKWASLNMEKPADRQLMINVAIHSADLGGNAQPHYIADLWRQRIHREFTVQVEKEQSLGMESLSFMMGLDDPIVAAKNQQSFLDFVMKPLWKNITLMWPQIKESEDFLDKNREENAKIFASSKRKKSRQNSNDG